LTIYRSFNATTLRWRLLSAPELADQLWTLWADCPHEQDPTLSWALTVRVGIEANRTTVFVHLGLRSLAYQLAPLRFEAGAPALVEMLTEEMEVVEDHWMLSTQPLRFFDREGVGDLVELLEDPTRVLPGGGGHPVLRGSRPYRRRRGAVPDARRPGPCRRPRHHGGDLRAD
jgi:hypothetical protein